MIIGNGQISKSFRSCSQNNIVVFASGVANSNTTDIKQFEREKNLLLKILQGNQDKRFVYFSSCALSAVNYPKNSYYKHKNNMENLIKQHSNNYYIFRIPQLFGHLILHKTLINFIYQSIQNNHKFNVYDEAYRYVIEINDVRRIVEAVLKYHDSCMVMDIANPYRYKVLYIVNVFEKLLDKKANYELIPREDSYVLNLLKMEVFIKKFGLDMKFGEDYLIKKLKEKIKDSTEERFI